MSRYSLNASHNLILSFPICHHGISATLTKSVWCMLPLGQRKLILDYSRQGTSFIKGRTTDLHGKW